VAFLQGFCHFLGAERGELRGTTWWVGGESVAGNDSNQSLKNMPAFAFFRFICNDRFCNFAQRWVGATTR
jgi:hypothetical protein